MSRQRGNIYTYFRAAFKFGRRVLFALRRKMLKLPIARIQAIKLEIVQVEKRTVFIKQMSSELRHGPNGFQFKT